MEKLSLSEAFELYRNDVVIYGNLSHKTEENLNITKKLLTTFLGDIPVCEVTFRDIRDWKVSLSKTRKDSTVRTYILSIRSVFRHLNRLGVESIDTATIDIPKRPKTIPLFILSADVDLLIESCRDMLGTKQNRARNVAIISLLFGSGIRVGELCAMNILDIHDRSFTAIGKSKDPRLCFIDTRTELYINNYLSMRTDNSPALFIQSQNNKRLTPSTAQHVLKFARRRIGMQKPASCHTLRHSFATDMMKRKVDIRYIGEWLGHQSLDTTKMYTHIVDEDSRSVYEQAKALKS